MSGSTEVATVRSTASLPTRLLQTPIRWYQVLFSNRPSPCRHVPSCSTYAIEALEAHGVFKGGWLSLRRLSRCHPWGTAGYDPVPGAESESKEN